jgi:hypothetical protein
MDKLIELVTDNFVPFLLVLGLLGSGDFISTEALKKLSSKIWPSKWEGFKGDWNWLIAIVFGIAIIYGGDVDIFNSFPSLSPDSATAVLPPDLAKFLQALLIGLTGHKINDKLG